MYRRPFLVLPGGDCIPLEGDWRLESLRGEWYVLGHHSAFRFETESEAQARLATLRGVVGPDALAELALELPEEEPGLAAFATERPRSLPSDETSSRHAPDRLFGESDLR